MSCIVYRTDSYGRKYAYRSESYWDKEKGQPRSKRTYLGRVNPETGEIMEGRQNGRNYKAKKDTEAKASTKPVNTKQPAESEPNAEQTEIEALQEEKRQLEAKIEKLTQALHEASNILSRAM